MKSKLFPARLTCLRKKVHWKKSLLLRAIGLRRISFADRRHNLRRFMDGRSGGMAAAPLPGRVLPSGPVGWHFTHQISERPISKEIYAMGSRTVFKILLIILLILLATPLL